MTALKIRICAAAGIIGTSAFTAASAGQIGGTIEDWNQWSEVASLPAARGGLAAGVLNGALYALGGYDTDYKTNVYRYDGTNWIEVASLPAARYALAAGVLNGALYALGGYDSDWKTNVYRYDGTNWTEVAGLPAPRDSLAAGVLNNALYAVGGAASGGAQTNVYRYDGTNWTEVASLPSTRYALAVGVLNNALYAVGGFSGVTRTNVYRYDGTNWTEVAGLPAARENLAAGVLNGALYAVGGDIADGTRTNVYRYDGTNWTEVAGLSAARNKLAAGVMDGALYALGGYDSGYKTNVYRYPGLVPYSGVSPSSGSYTGGYPVTISGTNLCNGTTQDVTSVTLCGITATVQSVAGSTQIVVVAGVGIPALGDVRVFSTSFGTTIKSNGFTYNPVITAGAGPHGAVAPSGVVDVVYGGSASFVATADVYYHIGSLTTNGVSVGEATNQPVYTSVWVNVIATGALTAAFAENLTTNTSTPEWWLAQYGWTNNFNAAATNDADGDRMLTWMEYLAGTVPTNSSSVLAIVGIYQTNGEMRIEWKGGTNAWQILEFRKDLVSTIEQWLAICTNPPPTPVTTNYLHDATTNDVMFYRIKARRE